LLYLGFGIVILLTLYRQVGRGAEMGAASLSPAGDLRGAVSHTVNIRGLVRGLGAAGDTGRGKTAEASLAPTGDLRAATRHTVNIRGLGRVVGGSLATIVAWIGVYSYSIYLWHLAVKRWGVPMIVRGAGLAPTGSTAVVVYFASAILIGAAMARLIESPGLALRDRWLPSRSGRAVRPVGLVDSVPVVSAYI